MTCANHDVQFLFTNVYALAVIHYILKYITKPEATTHTKLMIAAATRAAFSAGSNQSAQPVKSMLLKIYNKIDGHREVSEIEAASHLLDLPDDYTDQSFYTINTTHLLHQIKRSESQSHTLTDNPDSEIVMTSNGLSLTSLFQDYTCRGPVFKNYCLYDYCATVYKQKGTSGTMFTADHPQHSDHSQYLRDHNTVTPNLVSNIQFLKHDAEDDSPCEDLYRLLSTIFIPWTTGQMIKCSDLTWRESFHVQLPSLKPRIRRYVDNLHLLHKSKDEIHVHQLINSQAMTTNDRDDNDDTLSENSDIESILSFSSDHEHVPSDWYVEDGIQATQLTGFFDHSYPPPLLQPSTVPYTDNDTDELFKTINTLTAQLPSTLLSNITPTVFLNRTDFSAKSNELIHKFSLKRHQSYAFLIIAVHSIGIRTAAIN